jgi:hypothetical protein
LAPCQPPIPLVLPANTISISSSTLRYSSRAPTCRKCVAARVSGLPATFTCTPSPTAPSVTASVSVYPSSLELAWQPSWRILVALYRGPASVLQVVSRVGQKILDSINMMACTCCVTPLFLAFFHSNPPHRLAADAYRLIPLSLLPYLKKRIGNLQCCALACTMTALLESTYGAIAKARNANRVVAHW